MPSVNATGFNKKGGGAQQGGSKAYERELDALDKAKEGEPSTLLLRRVKSLEQITLLRQLPSSAQQQAYFFYQAGQIYAKEGQLSLSHESFTLCQRRIKASNHRALYELHLAWARVTDALRMTMYAYRSYSIVVVLCEQDNLGDRECYAAAVARRTAMFARLTR